MMWRKAHLLYIDFERFRMVLNNFKWFLIDVKVLLKQVDFLVCWKFSKFGVNMSVRKNLLEKLH